VRTLDGLRGRVVDVPLPGGPAPAAVAAYRRAFRRLGPDVVHVVDVDPPALLGARLAGVRALAVTYHTPEHRPRDNLAGRALRRLAWAVRPHVIFTSEPDRQTGVARDPIAPARTSVIPFGIDFERFSPAVPDRLRAELGLAQGTRVVGTVGLLRPQKAHERLLAAAERVLREEPDTVFVVVGDGPLRAELDARVRERGLDRRFVLLGRRDDVPELLAGFDVFALPSDFEGMCFAVVEAMAMEKPVVATAVGGVPASVVPGETGLLVPPGESEALADAILWTLRRPEEAVRMGRAGRERAERLFSLARMAEDTAALYERLARVRSRAAWAGTRA
jgi:glycosyltransferase involved in cell wall biosynthesis